MFVDVDHTHYR